MISRTPSRDHRERRYLHPDAFQTVWNELDPFNIDLMASTASAPRVPPRSHTRPFSSQYNGAGSSGVDVLAQDVARSPGIGEPAFAYCFPAPVMA